MNAYLGRHEQPTRTHGMLFAVKLKACDVSFGA